VSTYSKLNETILVLVEDSYGVDFHRELIEKLRYIEARIPAYIVKHVNLKCSPKALRVVKAIELKHRVSKVIAVLDEDGVERAEVKREVLGHFKGYKQPLLVITVKPRHEAWLCIGLGGDRSSCRANPEREIERITGRSYEKYHLAGYARRVEVERLPDLNDFREYLKALSDC